MILKLILFTWMFSSLGNCDVGTNLTCNQTVDVSLIVNDENIITCYPWMFHNETSGACKCSDILPNQAVLCDPTIPRTLILKCYCMTFNKERHETELGLCLYGCGHSDNHLYRRLPQNLSDLNTYTCKKANRESTLCGKCKSGYSPLVYSYDMSCMNCTGMTYNWIKYIAVAYIPITFFFLFVVFVRFNGTSPLVRGCISICQALTSPTFVRAYLIVVRERKYVKILSTLYGIWNLDFFRTIIPPICLDVSPLQALALDYGIAFYPLLLVAVTYILISLYSRDVRIVVWIWKPFHKLFRSVKQDWKLEESMIKAFATFFLLSYLKIFSVTVDLLVYTYKYTLPVGDKAYQVKYVLYYDASVEYLQGQHFYYGITAIFVGIFMVILPLVFLVVYPMRCFQKCLNYCRVQRQSIDTFVSCYQGYYKDGTNGTCDCRCFSVALFFVQIVSLTFFVVSRSSYSLIFGAMMLIIVMFFLLAVQPYKEQFKVYTIIDAFMCLILALALVLTFATYEASIHALFFSISSSILLGVVEIIPCLYLIGLIIWWSFVKKKLQYKLPCFRVQEPAESQDNDCFPHRVENPMLYQGQEAPLLGMSHY